jgi:cation diffusion facilitator family transporter
MTHEAKSREKRTVALVSVLAAVGLTAFKLTVGLLTNSLGILAEAAHSGLDLVAAAMTFFAVRVSDKPADTDHQYGHGKIENLSALFETLLLLATSGWIIYEAIDRLFFNPASVEASPWAFVVMGTSIVIDINRSRMLSRAAKKYNSQALEADALHFSTDIWSSGVVILGLIGISLSKFIPGLDWMHAADSIAALVVALIVIYISAELGWRTIAALLDAAPRGMAEKIETAASGVNGVVNAHAIRIRPSGPVWFIDLHINMDGDTTLNAAHAATEVIEKMVQSVIPGADVTVHVEPADPASGKKTKRK